MYTPGMAHTNRDLSAAWESLMPLFLAKRDQYFAEVGLLGITPPHGHALTALAHPRRMRELAELMSCDASYVTSIVDRLEGLGLVQRRPSTEDRRVTEVALTTSGEAAVVRLQAAMSRPPDVLLSLSEADQRTLIRILGKLPAAAPDANGSMARWGASRSGSKAPTCITPESA